MHIACTRVIHELHSYKDASYPTECGVFTGRLSDRNINPAYLSTLVFVGSNLKLYVPPMNDIWQRHLRKFSKNGKLLEDACPDLGLTADVTQTVMIPVAAPSAANSQDVWGVRQHSVMWPATES